LEHVIINLFPKLSEPHYLIFKYHIFTYTQHENVISNINIQINCRVSNINPKKVNNYYIYYEICFENLYIPVLVRNFFSTGHGNRKFYKNNKLIFYSTRQIFDS
jgi:hypothetical protein